MTTRRNGRRRDVLAGGLLAALLFRAYIPVGFMPASGSPFMLELCPAQGVMRMAMPGSHQRHHPARSHIDVEICPFGSAPASGPASQLVVFQPPGPITAFVIPSDILFRVRAQPQRAHRPRGPPTSV